MKHFNQLKPETSYSGKVYHLKIFFSLFLVFQLMAISKAIAQSFPTGFTRVQVANGISSPTALAFAPDGRIFVTEQGGKLRIIKNGTLLSTAAIQLTVDSNGERGLNGIALDPNFGSNGFIYVYYTVPGTSTSSPFNRVSRFTMSGDVVSGNATVLLNTNSLTGATNHNGGALHFGTDGKLYIAVGDNANGANAQNLDNYLGKILRINSDGTVPSGNPFNGNDAKNRIWSYGLRNPFTFNVQPTTGKIFVNDVGQNTWEEINNSTSPGLNFGWPNAEGNSSNTSYTNPLYAYQHGSGDGVGCAIGGGTFFNPTTTNYPASYVGKYFFLDYCNAWINYIDAGSTTPARNSFATAIGGSPVDLGTGNDGNLYYLSRNNGALYKVVYNNATAPAILTQPANSRKAQGQTASFTVTVSGTDPLTFQWRKNGTNISGATSQTLTLTNVQLSDAAEYSVVVSNSQGSVTSNSATLTVTAPNTNPVAEIAAPLEGAVYKAGDIITFSGSGIDTEDGTLPASAFAWSVIFHHATHSHPGPSVPKQVKSGTFTIPTSGETAANVWYRIFLIVTDSNGATSKDSVDIFPYTITLGLATSPSGLQVKLDDQPTTTPTSITAVTGMSRTLGVVSPQTVNGITYEFDSWAHGGTATQVITVPDADVTYTAIFKAVQLAVTSLTLINADTDLPIAGYDPIPANAILNFSTLPTRNLSIRANTNPAIVGSVKFAYDGNESYRTENASPYCIAGDNNGNFIAWTPTVGNHVLKCTPFSSSAGSGTAGSSYTVNFTVTENRIPENPANAVPGVKYSYYEGSWNTIPAFNTLTAVKTGNIGTINLSPRNRNDNFAFRYSGYIDIPTGGQYTFYTSSDDGSRLYIGNTLVVDNDGLHPTVEKSGTIGLGAGKHAITVTFFEKTGEQVLVVSYAGPSIVKQAIPGSALFANSTSTSSIAEVNLSNDLDLETAIAYPNPTASEVQISFTSNTVEKVNIKVIDKMGHLLYNTWMVSQKGINKSMIDLGTLREGVYSIVILSGKNKILKRVILKK